ncbi:MAG TPA: hypothetical protein VEX62_02675 [Candidatus Limnocylindrales bacterium]|nr:hypothetical protein [Candidatus Limnocylindrales bacterium]
MTESTSRQPRVPFPVVAAALGLVVLVPAALIAAIHGFDGLYGQDSFGYVDYALGPAVESLRSFQALPDFHWPVGYPFAVALVAMATGLEKQAGQLVSVLAGAAVPVLVAFLAREMIPLDQAGRARWAVPILAGLVVAVAGQLWQSSLVAMSDTTALALATLGAWAACRYARSGSLPWILLACAAAALAIEVRLIYAVVGAPIAFVVARSLVHGWRLDPRRAAAHAIAAAVLAVVLVAPALGEIGDASNSQSWNPAFAAQSVVETLDGRLTYELPMSAFYLLQPVQTYWFSLLAVLALPGIAAIVRRRDPIQIALLIAWPALVLVFLAGNPYQNTRYFLAAAPPVAILISLGTLVVWRFLKTPITVLVVVAALVLGAFNASNFTYAFVERVSRNSASIRALAAHVPPDARLITLGATAQLRHDRIPNVIELASLDQQATAQLLADGRPTYLLIDRASIAGQWTTRAPAAIVASIEAAPGLREVDVSGIWTLYEVAPI